MDDKLGSEKVNGLRITASHLGVPGIYFSNGSLWAHPCQFGGL